MTVAIDRRSRHRRGSARASRAPHGSTRRSNRCSNACEGGLGTAQPECGLLPQQQEPAMTHTISRRRRALCTLALGGLAGCGDTARLPPAASEGAHPQLPAPNKELLPTVHIAPAKGWPDGKSPTAASGLQVQAFAAGLNHPRWLLALPNGDVLVKPAANAWTCSPDAAVGDLPSGQPLAGAM